MNAHKARRREEIMDLILPHDVMYVDGWKNESIYMYLQIYIYMYMNYMCDSQYYTRYNTFWTTEQDEMEFTS